MSPSTPAATPDTDYLPAILHFLARIGIPVEEAPLSPDTFLPGILIHEGRLRIDRQRLLYPGDVLHEAGHLAVTAAAERPTLGGHLTENHPEKEGEELAVLLWTYAAALAMNLPGEVVFHPAGYNGNSAWLLESFRSGQYIGLPLLVWMGLSTPEDFPRMTRWLRG